MNLTISLLGALALATSSGCDSGAEGPHLLAPAESGSSAAGSQPSPFFVADSGFVHLAIGAEVTLRRSSAGQHPLRQSRASIGSTSWTIRDSAVARLSGERLSGRLQGHTWLVWAEGSTVDSTLLVVSPAPIGYLVPRLVELETPGAAVRLKGPTGDSAVMFSYSGSPSATVSAAGDVAPTAQAGAGVVRGRSQGNRTMAVMVRVQQGVGAPPAPEPPRDPEPPAPPESRQVSLRLHRFAGAEASTVTSSAVPLPPGWANVASVDSISLRVNGAEVPVHVKALFGKHADGSLRSVLIQASITPEMVTGGAELAIGVPRTKTRAALDTVPLPNKAGVLLPFDPNYLVSTLVIGRTVARASTVGWPAAFGQYESKFDQFSAHHWNLQGDNWTENFYDRALAYFAFWVRTGNPVFFERGTLLAVNYRRMYLEANSFGAAEWWSYLEGLSVHYWLSGDGASRTAVYKTAENLHRSRGGNKMANLSHGSMDNRQQAKVLVGKVLSIVLEAPPYGAVTDWRSMAQTDLGWILSTQAVDGSYRWPVQCGASSNFTSAILGSALIEYYTFVDADSRILSALERNMRFMRTTQWLPIHQLFNYYSDLCPNIGGPAPAADLNGIFLESLGWLALKTGDSSWITFGDAVFAGHVANTWMQGSKQFSQSYQLSWRYHWYRAQAGQ